MTLQSNPEGGHPGIWFVLAMAHWQLGDKDQARKWYTQAVQWMHEQKATSQESRHLQRDAAALLKIDKPKPDPE